MVWTSFLDRLIPSLMAWIISVSLIWLSPHQVLAQTDLTVPDWFQSGIVQLQQGNYRDAIDYFIRSIQQRRDLSASYSNLCLARIHLHDYLNAWQDCTRSLQAKSHYLAYFHRGLAFYRLGDYEQAIADYNQTILLNPTYYQAYYNRGLVYSAQKDYLTAIADFNQSLRQITDLNPISLSSIYTDRGASYLALGNFNAAKADFDKALHLDKARSSAYYHRARIYRQWEYFSEAIEDFTRTLAIDPSSADAYIQRGLIWYRLGYFRAAFEDLYHGADYFDRQGEQGSYRSVLVLIKQIHQQLSTYTNLTV
jgi:tetratricopeptide (TPR) repeat protein